MTQNKRKPPREEHVRSVEALFALLTSSYADPLSTPDPLRAAIARQTSLAKFADSTLGIAPMSLNHQKRVASFALGGYSRLDRLRVMLLHALAPKACTDRASRADRSSDYRLAQEQREHTTTLLEDILILQRAYDLRCAQALGYATIAGPSTLALARKEQAELDASFRLMKSRLASNVIAFPTLQDV